jgi:uncharacterized membrane protein YfcA
MVFLWAAKVRFDVGAIMIAGQLIGAHFGSHLVIRKGTGVIRIVFLAVVFALTLKLLWDQFAATAS